MKPQDILFFIVLIFLLLKHNSRYAIGVGIISLILSIPLFSFWIFFTAERLTWYAWGFLLLGVLLEIITGRKKSENRH